MTISEFQPHTRRAVPAQRTTVARILRYSAVSILRTGWSLIILLALVQFGGLTAGWANVIATACGMGPAFELNRRWVWSKRGDSSLLTEILPFCAIAFAGLALSTLGVHLVNSQVLSAGWHRTARTEAIGAANFCAFGTVWILQYVLLDRLVFGRALPGRVAEIGRLE